LLGDGFGDGGRDGDAELFREDLGFDLFARGFATDLFARGAAQRGQQRRAFPEGSLGRRSTFLPNELRRRAEQQRGCGPVDPGTAGIQQP
jgi:hypothetical protein